MLLLSITSSVMKGGKKLFTLCTRPSKYRLNNPSPGQYWVCLVYRRWTDRVEDVRWSALTKLPDKRPRNLWLHWQPTVMEAWSLASTSVRRAPMISRLSKLVILWYLRFTNLITMYLLPDSLSMFMVLQWDLSWLKLTSGWIFFS